MAALTEVGLDNLAPHRAAIMPAQPSEGGDMACPEYSRITSRYYSRNVKQVPNGLASWRTSAFDQDRLIEQIKAQGR